MLSSRAAFQAVYVLKSHESITPSKSLSVSKLMRQQDLKSHHLQPFDNRSPEALYMFASFLHAFPPLISELTTHRATGVDDGYIRLRRKYCYDKEHNTKHMHDNIFRSKRGEKKENNFVAHSALGSSFSPQSNELCVAANPAAETCLLTLISSFAAMN